MFDVIKIYRQTLIDSQKLKRGLLSFGYQQVKLVNQQGDFALRGNIIDVYPVTYDNPLRIELFSDEVKLMFSFDIQTGKPINYTTIMIILPAKKNILKRFRGSNVKLSKSSTVDNFNQIYPGDYVVHLKHGIGKFLGLEKIETKDGFKEHLKIEYAEGNKLYVPADRIHMVQRYISFKNTPLKLHKLGTKQWQKTKGRVKRGIESLAAELLYLQAMRSAINGNSFSKDHPWQAEFEKTFAYKETPDQNQTANEIKKDMESAHPMDRLVCGDVGYGKTEVAFRAAFKTIMDHKQVAMLVPTTILAQQHFSNLIQRVKDFPIEVRVLSRFNTDFETKQILKGLKEGKVDMVIGTHRLLSNDVKFKDLGLVIIDEEQRFGVRHKEKLKTFRLLVDVLTLTATPIPRTLYMSLMNVKDLSTINTPPKYRLPIETYVLKYDEELIRQAVLREVRRGGQVYFIHNRVKDINIIKEKLEHLIPEVNIAVAHGQMPEKVLEKTMIKFIGKQVDVLLSTNIVESGLDIANANTLIVNNSQMFGLGDLYQLRGRIGRFSRKAYCYFMIPPLHVIDTKARRRLEVIEKFTDLGSGFKIAMEDLELRGAGNLLGPQQHGYIAAVGFDLYSKLLKDSVEKLKKSNIKRRIERENLVKVFSNN